MSTRTLLRIMAGLCLALAVICAGLAVAYGRKVAELRCVSDFADMGLPPPAGRCP